MVSGIAELNTVVSQNRGTNTQTQTRGSTSESGLLFQTVGGGDVVAGAANKLPPAAETGGKVATGISQQQSNSTSSEPLKIPEQCCADCKTTTPENAS